MIYIIILKKKGPPLSRSEVHNIFKQLVLESIFTGLLQE